MNCRDINHLLDTGASEDLTSSQRENFDLHLATCPACSEEWATWHEIASLVVPATPAGLRARIAAAVAARRKAVPARRAFRPFVIGSLLVVGAALAAGVALRIARPDPEHVAKLIGAPQAASDGLRGKDESDVSQSLATPVRQLPAANGAAGATAEVLRAMDPRGIVVLLRPEAGADSQAITLAGECLDAIVSGLRDTSLNVVAENVVSAQQGSPFQLPRSDREIAHRLGAGNVLVVSTENGCRGTLFDSNTEAPITGFMYGGRLPPQGGWNTFAADLVRVVRDKMSSDQAAVLAEARATLLNTALGDSKRLIALWRFLAPGRERGRRAVSPVPDQEVLAAAIALATKSPAADVRSLAWVALRGVENPGLTQPLLQALAADPDSTVRMQAALTLHAFLDEPAVRRALQHAAANDPASEPEAACCILTVREAAERALIPDAELKDWLRRTVLDEDLPARSRLLPLAVGSPDGRPSTLSMAEIGGDASRAVFEIGSREQDPRVRQMAWTVLARAAPDNAFVPVLLRDLTGNADGYVRAAAAKVLTRYTGIPEVREAFERARDDPSMDVRVAANAALEREKK